MAELREIKLLFIASALKDYMQRNKRGMEREIIRRNVRNTDELLKSIQFRTFQESAEGNATLSFALQGRFVDMGVGKGHPLGGGPNSTIAALSRAKGRKPQKVYSPIVYGNLNGLINDQLYGFTEETVKNIKQNLHAS